MARNIAAIARALPNANTVMSNPTGAFGGAIVPATQGGPASPLIASYAEWSAGRASSALPRDFSTFLAGTFGPLMPMQPQPINQPAPGEERPGPRRTQYPVSWNMPHGVPGDEGLKLASYASLRSVADTYSVARACIQLRKSELLGVDWDIVPTKDAEKKMRGDQKARREFDERRAKVVKFFQRPDSNYLAFRDWFAVLLEDVFVIDALTIYMWPSTRRGGGVMGSNLGELTAIDGTTIRPMYDIFGNLPRPPNPSYQQYLFGVPRSDFASIINGDDMDGETAEGLKLTREYRGDRLIYRPMVPRNWTPYGYGPVERALVPIMSGMQRQNWQLSYFNEGTVPGMIISTGDPNSTPNQCRELQDALNAMAGDPAWKHKIIVIPGGSKIDPLRPTELAGPFDEMVTTQVAMSFEVMPMELGLSTAATRNAMGAASNIAQASQDIQKRKGNVPVLEWFGDIFNFVVKSVLRQSDMQWHWNGLEEGEDEAATVDVLYNEVAHGGLSIDEARVIRGNQPWGIPLTSEPVYFTATGVIPLGSIDMATGAPVGAPPTNAMQAAAGVVPGAPPAFGAPPGGPGKPGAPNGKPKPKGPGPNGSGGGGAPTPAHAGAQAAITAAGHGGQALPANPKPLPKPVLAHQDPDSPLDRVSATKMAEVVDRARQRLGLPRYLPPKQIDDLFVPEIDGVPESARGRHATVFDPAAALRELDLIGNRLTKGRPLNGWTNRHIPADVFTALRVDGDITKARAAVQDATARQRRDSALAAAQQQVIAGLHQLAAGVGDGSVSTPGFIDAAVALMRDAIHEGLRLGTGHALVDAGRATQRTAWATKQASDGPGWVDGLDGRFGLYAGSIPHAYELGYGLATLGAHDDPDNLVIEWHARPDACDLCDTWSTMTWTAGTLPGMPGEGGFGKHATVCLGGPGCRCRLAYRLATPDEVEAIKSQHADRPAAPAQLDAADQRVQDAEAIRRALAADDPNAALALVLADLAAERAEAQRSWLTGLLKDILTAATRGANALRTWLVTKAFNPAEEHDEHGQWKSLTKAADPAAAVVAQMRENYPPKALGWMKTAQWSGPVDVPLNDIDFDDVDRWAASHDKARVKHFAKQYRKGRDVKPIVAVQEPGGDKVKIIDGHHRTLAARKLDRPVHAYVGTVDTDGGPWDETHVWQFHEGADPANKAAGTDLDKVRLPPGPRDWKEHPWSHGWVWHGPTAVGTVIDHKGFGKGHVTGTTKTRIKVMFPDGKERTFPHAAGVAAGKPTERKPRVVGEPKAVPKPRAPRKATTAPNEPQASASDKVTPTPKTPAKVTHRESLASRADNEVHLLTFDDGTKKVHKKTGKIEADREELGTLVGQALGAPMPAVHRINDRELHVDYAEGKATALDPKDERVQSDAGVLLGLADIITGNPDRGSNYLVGPHGVAGIDQGESWINGASPRKADGELEAPRTGGPFGRHFVNAAGYKDNDMSPADMAEVKRRFQALRPKFEAADAMPWYEQSMDRIEALTARAHGTRNRLTHESGAPTVPPGMHAATDEHRKAFREATGKPIPPAWADVHIADDLHGSRLLATGRDGKGRRQAIYSTAHTEDQAEAKFNRIQQFHEHLSTLDSALERDALTNDDAAALLLIRRLGMRPGSERDTGAELHAHGATNLLGKHVKVRGDTVTFNFTGKKGVDIGLRIKDPLIAEALSKRLATRKGNKPLFDTDESKVRKYMDTLVSPPAGFKLKDLRTLRANAVALAEIQKRARPPKTQAQYKEWRREVAEKVSAQLGNTPAVALSAYINPTVFTPWLTDPGWA